LSVGGDDIIVMLGQWLRHEAEAREMAFAFMCDMVRKHLCSGRDVILPYLVSYAEHADAFQHLAKECEADYFEVLLTTDRAESVERMFERGTWGERGTDLLMEKDRQEVERLYGAVHSLASKRPYVLVIQSAKGKVEDTYNQLIDRISKA
jgi:hypothetical protein